MKKLKKWLWSPAAAVLALVLAAGLLCFSGIGGARAALNDPSNWFKARVSMEDIGISLIENGKDEPVAYRNYDSSTADGTWLKNTPGILLADLPEKIVLGKPYTERLAVRNSGTINEFVRVTITRYWRDENGSKLTTLSPKLIDLKLENIGGAWQEDESARTEERTVLYYSKLLHSDGDTSAEFSSTLTISNKLADSVHKEPGDEPNSIRTVFDFDGVQFVLDVRCDGVQEHNAKDAIKSAWGVNVDIDGENMTFKGAGA